MSIKRFATVGTVLALGAIASSFSLSAIAQVMRPQSMLNALGRQCSQVTEVTYHSQRLLAPDGKQQVHVEGVLRKTVNPTSQLRQSDTEGFCYPDVRETVTREMVIQNADSTKVLSDRPYEEGYVIYQPRSFSSDSRFLAVDLQVTYTGGAPGHYVLFMDLENDQVIQTPDICDNLAFESYVGFASKTEAVVLCQDYGDPGEPSSGEPSSIERFETVNLLNGSVRQLEGRPDDLAGYGSITREFEVTKAQAFE